MFPTIAANADRGAQYSAASLCEDAARFARSEIETVQAWRELVKARASDHDVWLSGGSSKGVTFALLVEPEARWLKCAIDINQNKVGRFMPITGLPIAAPQVLRGAETVIIINPNYKAEITCDIERMGTCADVLSLGEA